MTCQILFSRKNIISLSSNEFAHSTVSVKQSFSTPNIFVLLCLSEVLQPSQSNGVMSSAVSLPNHTFTGQA